MRIIHVVPSYLPAVRYGGPIFSVHGLCRGLAGQGHDVHVYTTNVNGDGESPVPVGVPVDVEGVQVHYFPVPIARRLYWSPAMARALSMAVQGVDLVHAHSVFLWPTWLAARVARRAGKPYLISPRGMLVESLIRRRSRWAKSAWIALVERRNMAGAAALHVTSAEEERELRRLFSRLPAVRVVPNGVDLEGDDTAVSHARPADWPSDQRVLLFLGRLSWKKGIDRLIRSLALVPQTHLVIAGNDDEGVTASLSRLSHQVGVEGRVSFVGGVYGAVKEAYLQHASALVLPSYSENFGNVILEAMAAGCPVAATAEVGASAIGLEAGAGVVIPGDPVKMAEALRKFLDDPALATMGMRGRLVARRDFSWDAIAVRMTAFYESLMPTNNAKERVSH